MAAGMRSPPPVKSCTYLLRLHLHPEPGKDDGTERHEQTAEKGGCHRVAGFPINFDLHSDHPPEAEFHRLVVAFGAMRGTWQVLRPVDVVTHRVLTHETLSVPTGEAARQILDRWNSFDEASQRVLGTRRMIVDQAGFKVVPLLQFMNSLTRDSRQTSKSYDTIRYAALILPASFGGIERHVGLLNAAAPQR